MTINATDKQYLDALHYLPCCICEAFGETQLSPTQAHHVFHGRFSGRRTPHKMAIPICEGHHLGLIDTSKLAIHKAKKQWAEKYGFDHEWTAATQDKVKGLISWTSTISQKRLH